MLQMAGEGYDLGTGRLWGTQPSLSVLGPQLEALWKARDGPLAAMFLLFTKCPEVCSLSDRFRSLK